MPTPMIDIHEARFGSRTLRYCVADGEPYIRDFVSVRGAHFVMALDDGAIIWANGGTDVDAFFRVSWLADLLPEIERGKLLEIRRRLLAVHAATVQSPDGVATVEFPD